MTGMTMPQRAWYGAAAGYLGMWMAVMVPMMLPSFGAGVMAAEMRWGTVVQWLPVAGGAVLLVAGGVQLTPWKARQLTLCREDPGCGCAPLPEAASAWRHGLRLGVRCSLCCSSLMLALLAVGMMDLAAMAAVTLAISAERLAPAPLRIARVVGAAIVAAGVLTITRV
jgi:predicted metal-binding membrane protein